MADWFRELSNSRLVVAGEVGIDEYLWGDTRRISPEAPVPVVEVFNRTERLGLSGNVAQNIASLGAQVDLVTVCGADPDGDRLQALLQEARIRDTTLLKDESRPTLRKVRVIAQKQHLLRVDYEKTHILDAKLVKQFVEASCDRLAGSDGIILQDYAKGIWNEDTRVVIDHAHALKKPVFVDPNRNTKLSVYRNCTLLTPNMAEAEALCQLPEQQSGAEKFDQSRLYQLASDLLQKTNALHAIVTCGSWGMVSLSQENTLLGHIPTFAREVFDVTGAGDTVIAVLSLLYARGFSLPECIHVANAAAGIVVGKVGTASVQPAELKAALEKFPFQN